jgi:YHS domain-containing protein
MISRNGGLIVHRAYTGNAENSGAGWKKKIFTTEEHWGCAEEHRVRPADFLSELHAATTQRRGESKGDIFLSGGIMAIDPVCGMEINEDSAKAQTQFAGKKYYFCSEDCRKKFEEHPDEYMEATAA